jgi:hypothetical protein
MSRLAELASELRSEGGLLAASVRDTPAGEPLPGGPREEAELLLEAIREGHELHYGRSRLLDLDDDPDLALLAGDRLYAIGLERLAALGDLDAVRLLADLISTSARAHAEGRPEEAERAWAAAVARVHGAQAVGGPEPGATPT